MTLGDIENKPFLSDIVVQNVADNVALTAGMLVYQDGINGLKVVPTTAQPVGSRVRFLEKAADNTITGHALGLIKAHTFKKLARTVCRCDGVLEVGARVRASTTTAGRVIAVAEPADPGATYLEADVDSLYEHSVFGIGTYIGRQKEGVEIGNEPKDAADGDDVVIQWD